MSQNGDVSLQVASQRGDASLSYLQGIDFETRFERTGVNGGFYCVLLFLRLRLINNILLYMRAMIQNTYTRKASMIHTA